MDTERRFFLASRSSSSEEIPKLLHEKMHFLIIQLHRIKSDFLAQTEKDIEKQFV